MRENRVEARLTKMVKDSGGWALKFTSPGTAGVPDRIVIAPGGRICFVELKAPGNVPTALQAKRLDQLQALGCEVRVLDSLEKVDSFVRGFFV